MDIKTLRKRTGFSQKKFANIIGASSMSLRAWEHGIHKPQKKFLVKLLEIEHLLDNNAFENN